MKPEKASRPVLSLEPDKIPPELQPDIPHKPALNLTRFESRAELARLGIGSSMASLTPGSGCFSGPAPWGRSGGAPPEQRKPCCCKLLWTNLWIKSCPNNWHFAQYGLETFAHFLFPAEVLVKLHTSMFLQAAWPERTSVHDLHISKNKTL